ncbi:hypothetical protein T492DRAFT_843134 [Pavlovales sp. CCMP2436]|nr:hypothetical protein T492DRAFT_843134 [Pavlovales sp. CCMP2436]
MFAALLLLSSGQITFMSNPYDAVAMDGAPWTVRPALYTYSYPSMDACAMGNDTAVLSISVPVCNPAQAKQSPYAGVISCGHQVRPTRQSAPLKCPKASVPWSRSPSHPSRLLPSTCEKPAAMATAVQAPCFAPTSSPSERLTPGLRRRPFTARNCHSTRATAAAFRLPERSHLPAALPIATVARRASTETASTPSTRSRDAGHIDAGLPPRL